MTATSASAAPRYYGASWAAKPGIRIVARLIDSVIGFTIAGIVVVTVAHGRPFAQDLVILSLVAGLETLCLSRMSATLGMKLCDLRVRALDVKGGVLWLPALRRSVPIALCYTITPPGTVTMIIMPIVLAISLALSPFRQAFHERVSDTITVVASAPELISRDSFQAWYDASTLPVMTPWGRVPDLHERRRARAHRIDNVWWLAALVMLSVLSVPAFPSVITAVVVLGLIWMVVIGADETWRIAATGTTPGHARFGFSVVDMKTGGVPSRGRSFLRAVVLCPLLYVPPLQLILGMWVRASRLHRGPHDLAARTIVVEADFVPPAFAAPQWPMYRPGPAWSPYGYPFPPMHPMQFPAPYAPPPPYVPLPVPRPPMPPPPPPPRRPVGPF